MRPDRFKLILLIIIIFISVLILLAGCTTIIEDEENNDLNASISNEKITAGLPLESEEKESTEIPVKAKVQNGLCEPGWKCISSKYKAYQEANCAFTKKTGCPLGCFNNTCKAGKTCSVGFKCITATWSGYQKEDCDWINKELCEYGCSDGECLNATQSNPAESTDGNTDSTAEETGSSSNPEGETSAEGFSILKYGELAAIDGHDLSIYLLEVDRVKITIDSKNSNWLAVGESYAKNGLNVTIKEIMFQSYQEGTKAISYTSK